MKRAFITGAAGFIGSHIADALEARGVHVVGFDNFSTGVSFGKHRCVRGDGLNPNGVAEAMEGCDAVFHLSANADIRKGWDDPTRDIKQNLLATSNVLEAMRRNGVKALAFASSSAVYGESETPTHEDCPWPIQTSLYAASKVACEALIQAYCAGGDIDGYIFRFSPVVGERYTHGHIFDFVKALLKDPTRLSVMGDGTQRKSYVYVGDVVEGVLRPMDAETCVLSPHNVQIYNVSSFASHALTDSIGWICDEMGVTPEIAYGTENKGWVGDMPVLFPSPQKLFNTGWRPKVSVEEGIRRTVRWILENRNVIQERLS